jgi:hypothetical protein
MTGPGKAMVFAKAPLKLQRSEELRQRRRPRFCDIAGELMAAVELMAATLSYGSISAIR